MPVTHFGHHFEELPECFQGTTQTATRTPSDRPIRLQKRPDTPEGEEEHLAIEAMEGCPVEAIGKDGALN